ncbi:MAG TPA: B12-binding domain-containing radical SAM protein [Flavobacteriales bacterium]|nr:B12-binding domain-containing radical SAM protein [Flavobacteriales bacterium]
MKILLTHAYFLSEDITEQRIMKPYPPLGLLYISAYLEKNNTSHKVFDSTFSTFSILETSISDEQPDIIGIYCNLMTKVKVVRLMERIKIISPNTKIVVGGPDIRYNTSEYLNNGADVAVIGEGELSFLELSMAFGDWENKLRTIEGIAYKQNRDVHFTKERTLLKELDDLPYPAFHNIDTDKYLETWKKHHGKSMLSVSSQRGCPYTCKWCSTAVYGQSYRRKSPENLVRELIEIKAKYNPDAVWFVDDVFTVSHKWLNEFNLALKKADFNLPFECITRADRLNPEVVRILKEAGCFRVWIGAESGSLRILDAMDRRVDVAQVREMIQESKKAGIETGTFIMLGYPGEGIQDIHETVHHLIRSDPDRFTITLAYPIKGTGLFDEVKSLQVAEIDWKTQTDRERDFKRSFSPRFYHYALRYVVNEVRFEQLKKQKNAPAKRLFGHFIKSRTAAFMMQLKK